MAAGPHRLESGLIAEARKGGNTEIHGAHSFRDFALPRFRDKFLPLRLSREIAFRSAFPQPPAPLNASWDTLKTLSDPTRLRLLALLLREELSVAELQEILGMAQSRISSQLALLRQADLVSDRRDGKKAFYSLRPDLSARTLALVRSAVESVAELAVMGEDRDNLDRILHY